MASIHADQLSHHEIASALIAELEGTVDNLGWWAQATAVAWEQYVGRRVPGQRPDGTFQTSVSRSTSLGMEPLIEAWTDFAAADKEVLDRIAGDVRVSGTANRITWRTKGRDGTALMVISEPEEGRDRVADRPGARDRDPRGQRRGEGGLDRDRRSLRGDDLATHQGGPLASVAADLLTTFDACYTRPMADQPGSTDPGIRWEPGDEDYPFAAVPGESALDYLRRWLDSAAYARVEQGGVRYVHEEDLANLFNHVTADTDLLRARLETFGDHVLLAADHEMTVARVESAIAELRTVLDTLQPTEG